MKRIAHISDLHFGRVDPPVAEALLHDLQANPVDLLIISGDFTQRARPSQFTAAAAYRRRLPQPQLVVPGNHDIPLFDVLRRFLAPLSNYRKYITPDLRPTYRDDEILVAGVNTARPFSFTLNGFWKDGSISAEQLLDIRAQFADAPAHLTRILVTHHPFIPPPAARIHGIVLNAPRALAQLESSGLDLLLAGHLHIPYSGDVRSHHEATQRSILSIQAGTAISTRRRHQPNAYNLLTIHPNDITITVRSFTGSAFETAIETRFRRQDGIWHL